jgi:hypothetical protein
MKNFKKIIGLGLVALTLQTLSPAHAEATDRPHVISVELGGRGLLYSVNYDYAVDNAISIGAGLSYIGDSFSSLITVPVYGNYYFMSESEHRPFLTAGVDILVGSVDLGVIGGSFSGAAVTLGGGYEYRGDSGFVFRAAPYIFVAGGVGLTGGISFGGSF